MGAATEHYPSPPVSNHTRAGCWFGLGYGLGALLGGFVSQRSGYPAMYLLGATIMLCGLCVVGLGRLWASRATARQQGLGGKADADNDRTRLLQGIQ